MQIVADKFVFMITSYGFDPFLVYKSEYLQRVGSFVDQIADTNLLVFWFWTDQSAQLQKLLETAVNVSI